VQVDANTRGRSVPALRKRLLRYRPVSITEGPVLNQERLDGSVSGDA
jgi:hypothetical protein